jgi:hypothetical protein
MSRRHLLVLCAAGISGCAGLGPGDGETPDDGSTGLHSPTPTPTATQAKAATPVRRVDTQTRPLDEDLEPLREVTVDLLAGFTLTVR